MLSENPRSQRLAIEGQAPPQVADDDRQPLRWAGFRRHASDSAVSTVRAIHGRPIALRPIITAWAPDRASATCADRTSPISPFATTGAPAASTRA